MEQKTLNQLKTWKWLYIIVFVAIAALLISPIALPIKVNRWTKAYYEYVQKLPAGSLVIVSPDFAAAAYSELGFATQDVLKHLWLRGANVIIVGFVADAPNMADQALRALQGYIAQNNIVYGQDFVALPLIAGGDTGRVALAEKGKALLTTDVYGTPVSQIPILQGFNTAKDIKLVVGIDMSSGYSWSSMWYIPYQVPVAGCGPVTGMHTTLTNFDAGLFVGAIVGLSGTAEYESLLGLYTTATAKASITNVTMFTVVLTSLAINIAYLLKKFGGK